MSVLVTGHLGYVGSILVPRLQNAGHKVVGCDAGWVETHPAEPNDPGVPNLRDDIRDLQIEDLSGLDAIIHLAGISNDPLGDLCPDATYEVNHRASVRLARLAKAASVPRFLFASSCAVYGSSGATRLSESAPFNLLTPYARSKAMVEQDVSVLADESFSPTFLRCATAFGWSPRLRADLLVNNFVGFAMTEGRILLKSDGTPWRPQVHVEDIAAAFLACLEAPQKRVHDEAFNVAITSENYQIRDVALAVQAAVPGCDLTVAEGAGPDARCYCADGSKLSDRVPTFEPQWNLQTGIEQLVSEYGKRDWTRAHHVSSRHFRLARVKELQAASKLDRLLRLTSRTTLNGEVSTCEIIEECRSCHGPLEQIFSFGEVPVADRLIRPDRLDAPEERFPMTLAFCANCSLVQIKETVSPHVLFGDAYPYFSSFCEAWVAQCTESADELIRSRELNENSFVMEIAANDGYLLRRFGEQGIPVLGIDPAQGPVAAAVAAGVPMLQEYFTRTLAEQLVAERGRADLILANNVLAHVSDLTGFVAGMRHALKPTGVAVIEVPYVLDLVTRCEFDTIYHQHLCYFSLTSLHRLFKNAGLHINNVQRLPSHGGSLRVTVGHEPNPSPAAIDMLRDERDIGADRMPFYQDFSTTVHKVAERVRRCVTDLKSQGQSIAAYGAAAKGTMLMDYCGLNESQLDFVVDRNVHKHGQYMPGSRLFIRDVEALLSEQPDYLLVLAWNHGDEIMAQQADYRDRGGKFIIPIPDCSIL